MSREKLNQEIALLLQKKMQELNLKGEWTANANGVTCKIGNKDYNEGEQKFQELFGSNVAPTLSHNIAEPRTYTADYRKPSDLIVLLNKLGESDKAAEYQKAIEAENLLIATKLKQLMKEDKVQWQSNVNGVFCTHIQETSLEKYEEEGRIAGERAFESNLESYGVTVSPEIDSALGIEGRFDTRPGLVKLDVNFTSRQSLDELNAQVDKALSSGVTREKTSEFKANLTEIKREQVDSMQVCRKIKEFCNKYPGVDGLTQMQDIMFTNVLNQDKALNKVIELAEWKKSDSDFTKGFHNKMRGRAPEVEEFYQKLAKLDPNDVKGVKEFMSFVDEKMTPKDEQTQGYRF